MKAFAALAAALGVAGVLGGGAWLLGAPLDARVLLTIAVFALLAAGEAALSREGERRLDALAVRRGPGLPEALGSLLVLALELEGVVASRSLWGLALVGLGGTLRLLAIHRLGAAFVSGSELSRAQTLEQGGVYRIARHPSELGLLLLAAGCVAMAPNPWSVGLALTFLASALWRVQREDDVLAQQFGAGFEVYRRRVGALGLRVPR